MQDNSPICSKRCFQNKKDAITRLNSLRKSSIQKKPERAYYCDICKAWHITSMKAYNFKLKPVDNSDAPFVDVDSVKNRISEIEKQINGQ